MTTNFKEVTAVPRCQSEWPEKMQAAARDALRRALPDNLDYDRRDLSADVIIEAIWNAVVRASGHDMKA